MQNPYETLGVEATATDDQIKKAYRALAAKHHPDQDGGDAEMFNTIKTAYDLLRDPVKRQRFDDEGVLDDGKPDNTQSLAMEQVASFFIRSIDASLDRNNALNLDQLDLVVGAQRFFDQQINATNVKLYDVETRVKQFKKALKRLKKKGDGDLIKDMIESHISSLASNKHHYTKEISVFKAAKDILKDYSFEQEQQMLGYGMSGFTYSRRTT
jgi:curved DNA-binding protein CbpA